LPSIATITISSSWLLTGCCCWVSYCHAAGMYYHIVVWLLSLNWLSCDFLTAKQKKCWEGTYIHLWVLNGRWDSYTSNQQLDAPTCTPHRLRHVGWRSQVAGADTPWLVAGSRSRQVPAGCRVVGGLLARGCDAGVHICNGTVTRYSMQGQSSDRGWSNVELSNWLIDFCIDLRHHCCMPECVHADLETMNIRRCCCSNLDHQALQYSS
jgi:hypothetical protein